MTESFLQFVWKNKLFDTEKLCTAQGAKIEVIDTGEHNTHAGPDFINVKIKVDKTIWAGCAEIHVRASDWDKHNNSRDKAYNNVILHLVKDLDREILRENGEPIFASILVYDKRYLNAYLQLYHNQMWVPCQKEIKAISPFILRQWLGRILVERLEKKSEYIITSLKANKNNWEETFYQMMARNFGLHVNAQPFEMLAKSIPLNVLAKHKDNLMQIEALLFGQAGLLNENKEHDGYNIQLQKEYKFLRKKYHLSPMDKHLWKFLRLRPVNFPTIRLSQFACLINKSSALFSKLLECKQPEEVRQLLRVSTSEYWRNHYTFGKTTKVGARNLGSPTIDIIIINTIVPFLFIYGRQRNIESYVDKSLQLLESLKPENNVIIRNWAMAGITAENAFYSQALIQLKNEYCKFRKCLDCQVGNSMIMKAH